MLWGINSNTIANGIVATVALTISPSTLDTSSTVQLTNGAAAALDSTPLTTTATGNTVTIIQTPPTWSMSGTITSGSGASGRHWSGAASATVTADSSGNYTFTGLANGAYTVTPSKSGFTMSPVNRAVTISGASAAAVNFTATPITYSISGTITGGKRGPSVTLEWSSVSATVTADTSSGNFTFTGLANGAYTVTPSKSGFTMSPVPTGR